MRNINKYKIINLIVLLSIIYVSYIEVSSFNIATEINTLFAKEELSLMDFAFMGGPLVLKMESSNWYKRSRIRFYIADETIKNLEIIEKQIEELEDIF